MLRISSNQRGWVFIDALIGMVIVALALTALAMAYRQTAVVSASATNYLRAVYIAQEALDNLKGQVDNTQNLPNPSSYHVERGNIVYDVIYSLPAATTDRLGNAITNLFSYSVTVQWTENGQAVQIVVSSYYYLTPSST
jgi:Tfp pilus assembly protein PilX